MGISKIWVKKATETDPENAMKAKRIYKMIGMLPLLPHGQFLAGHKYVCAMTRKYKLMNKFAKFFNYYDRTWIAEVRLRNISIFEESIFSIFSLSFLAEQKESTFSCWTYYENNKFY